MRTTFAAAVLLGAAALTLTYAQPPKDPPKNAPPKEPESDPQEVLPRYGVKPRLKQYPQITPKETLKSVLTAVDAADYSYLAAHLLDPKFVDGAVTERAKLLEPAAELELAQLRDYQQANKDRFAPEDRIPLDPKGLRDLAAVKARDRGFKQALRDIQQKLTDDPQTVKDLRRVLRDGMFADADAVATASHPDVKGRTFYFRKFGDRWVLENRQVEEPKKEP